MHSLADKAFMNEGSFVITFCTHFNSNCCQSMLYIYIYIYLHCPGTMSDTKEMINNLIQEKKVVVISKSYCPYCTKAKVRMLSYLNLIVHTALKLR